MSEFKKELESILEKNGEYYQGITTGNVLGISKHFKDWHSADECKILKAELERVYTILGFLVKSHSELWTVTDGRGQFENALDDAENILRNRE